MNKKFIAISFFVVKKYFLCVSETVSTTVSTKKKMEKVDDDDDAVEKERKAAQDDIADVYYDRDGWWTQTSESPIRRETPKYPEEKILRTKMTKFLELVEK